MKRYFYARVSAKDQSLERQLEAARNYKDDIDRVFADKQSGKNFERVQYQAMKDILEPGDEVVVKELDRLGRNSQMVKDELAWFRERGVTMRILDIPTTLLDFGEQDWVREMVTNILVEVLSAMAEQEREKIERRQREGIAAMPVVDGKRVSAKTGRGFGRPVIDIPTFDVIRKLVETGEMTVTAACKELGISRDTYYRRAREV